MRKAVFFLSCLMLSACAPLVCPEADTVKSRYGKDALPTSYEANLSLRYGLFRISLNLYKSDGKFLISGEGRTAEVKGNSLCFAGSCLEVPISPDGILFGKVLKGDERMECSKSGLVFEKEDDLFKSKYVFMEGRLTLAEFYDKKKDRTIKLNYLEWSKEGYAKAIRVESKNTSFFLTVNSLKF